MNIFISWSGERSRLTAELLKHWIKSVIQSTNPWVSTKDIERGAPWASVIGNKLQETTNGVICLTKENKSAPWILFEAGALAKGLQTSRIYTLLIDLEPADVTGPLAQFNHTRLSSADMFKLIHSININNPAPLDTDLLKRSFEAFWPEFEREIKNIKDITENTPEADQPSTTDYNREIVSTLRNIQSRLSDIESSRKMTAFLSPSFRRDLEPLTSEVEEEFDETYERPVTHPSAPRRVPPPRPSQLPPLPPRARPTSK